MDNAIAHLVLLAVGRGRGLLGGTTSPRRQGNEHVSFLFRRVLLYFFLVGHVAHRIQSIIVIVLALVAAEEQLGHREPTLVEGRRGAVLAHRLLLVVELLLCASPPLHQIAHVVLFAVLEA